MNDTVGHWQRWMLESLLRPQQASEQAIEERFVAGARLSAKECLGIYQRGYILRLIKCLAEQFPALNHALGDKLFEQFARRYLREFPSDSYTLYELGRRFADFLEQDRPDREALVEEKESWIDFMVDLASYERLHFSLFDAVGNEGKVWPDHTVSDERLVLQPCFALAHYRFPVGWYYHAIKENPNTPFPSIQASHVALLRMNYQVTTFPVSQVHYLFLQHLVEHNDIGSALQHISRVTKAPLEAVKTSWRTDVRDKWIAAGFFVSRG